MRQEVSESPVTLGIRYLGFATVVLIVASFAVRLTILGTQSYWGDELFSARESSGGLEKLADYAMTEVHTPLYALFLFVWVKFGQVVGITGTSEWWTHLLSLAFVAVGVFVGWTGLRRAGVSRPGMWAGLVAVSVSGFAMTYSLESRDYALLLAGSVASTAYSLVVVTQIRAGHKVQWWLWMVWALFAATSHVFGLLLVLVQGLAIVVFMGRPRWKPCAWPLIRSVVVAVSLQAAWIAYGVIYTQGFAGNTSWISSPTLESVWLLLTSTFSSGQLRHDADGFAWRSPWGVVVVVTLALIALVLRVAWANGPKNSPEIVSSGAEDPEYGGRETVEGPRRASEVPDGFAAAYFGLITAVVIAVVFLVSQFVHIWTLRNMLVAFPALVWALAFGLMWLARAPGAKVVMGWVFVGTCVALLAVSVSTMLQPYKQDYRGFADYVLQVHEVNPEVRVRNRGWLRYLSLASNRPISEFSEVRVLSRREDGSEGEVIVSVGSNGTTERARDRANKLIIALDRSDCEVVPFAQLAVVHCGAAK